MLKSNINYIPLSDVIAEVKASLSSYFESGFDVSEAIFIPQVRTLLRKLGPKIKSTDSDIITIENYKGKLPTNFYRLLYAVGCFKKQEYIPNIEVNTINIIEDISVYKIDECVLNPCTNECGEFTHIMQKTKEGEWVQYVDFKPLQLCKTAIPSVESLCLNLHMNEAEDEISFDKNNILTNFPSGYVYMEYTTLLEDSEGNIIIPEDEIIVSAFRSIIRLAVLEYLLFNTTMDVGNLYKLQSQLTQHDVSMAVNLVKTPEVSDVRRIRDYKVNEFNRYRNLNY